MIELTNIEVSEGSVTEPVILDEAKAWLQIDFSDHDALLTSLITGARQSIEKWLNLALVDKTVTLDADNKKGDWDVMFPYARTVADVVVNGLDSSDVSTVLTIGEDYYVRSNSLRIGPGRHYITYSITAPPISQDLKEAILMEVAERYRNRGENNAEGKPGLSEGATIKAAPHQMVWL
jgi:hypothetical protein